MIQQALKYESYLTGRNWITSKPINDLLNLPKLG